MSEQLIMHLEKLALSAGALRGVRREARIFVDRQRKVAIAPPHPSGVDQLLLDRRHLDGGERRADRTLEIEILRDLDRRAPLPERVTAKSVVRDRRWRARRGGWRRSAGAQQREDRDPEH